MKLCTKALPYAKSTIVTLVLSCPVSPILQVSCWELPRPCSTRIWDAFPLDQPADVVAPRTEDLKLIISVTIFELVQLICSRYINVTYRRTDSQTDRQTDGQTDGWLTIAILRFALRASRGKNATAVAGNAQKNKKLGKFCGMGRSRANKLSASGASRLTLQQGLRPQIPAIGSRSTRSSWDLYPSLMNTSGSAPGYAKLKRP